jgi:hypothetical protein
VFLAEICWFHEYGKWMMAKIWETELPSPRLIKLGKLPFAPLLDKNIHDSEAFSYNHVYTASKKIHKIIQVT